MGNVQCLNNGGIRISGGAVDIFVGNSFGPNGYESVIMVNGQRVYDPSVLQQYGIHVKQVNSNSAAEAQRVIEEAQQKLQREEANRKLALRRDEHVRKWSEDRVQGELARQENMKRAKEVRDMRASKVVPVKRKGEVIEIIDEDDGDTSRVDKLSRVELQKFLTKHAIITSHMTKPQMVTRMRQILMKKAAKK